MMKVADAMREEGLSRGNRNMTNIAEVSAKHWNNPDLEVMLLARHALFRYAESRGMRLESFKPH
jgi:hypothetical protein